jgi:hypothetical protein
VVEVVKRCSVERHRLCFPLRSVDVVTMQTVDKYDGDCVE